MKFVLSIPRNLLKKYSKANFCYTLASFLILIFTEKALLLYISNFKGNFPNYNSAKICWTCNEILPRKNFRLPLSKIRFIFYNKIPEFQINFVEYQEIWQPNFATILIDLLKNGDISPKLLRLHELASLIALKSHEHENNRTPLYHTLGRGSVRTLWMRTPSWEG